VKDIVAVHQGIVQVHQGNNALVAHGFLLHLDGALGALANVLKPIANHVKGLVLPATLGGQGIKSTQRRELAIDRHIDRFIEHHRSDVVRVGEG
jgi:hypothetical protein